MVKVAKPLDHRATGETVSRLYDVAAAYDTTALEFTWLGKAATSANCRKS